jgi:2-oxoglutarate decarboxylase
MVSRSESLLSGDRMSVDTTVQVVMPQMGDSVAEGTVLEWHKAEGDSVEVDETIVEISTDKVDAEVPSPASGTVVKIVAAEGDTVSVGSVLCEIAPTGGTAARGNGNGNGSSASATAAAGSAPAEPAM